MPFSKWAQFVSILFHICLFIFWNQRAKENAKTPKNTWNKSNINLMCVIKIKCFLNMLAFGSRSRAVAFERPKKKIKIVDINLYRAFEITIIIIMKLCVMIFSLFFFCWNNGFWVCYSSLAYCLLLIFRYLQYYQRKWVSSAIHFRRGAIKQKVNFNHL